MDEALPTYLALAEVFEAVGQAAQATEGALTVRATIEAAHRLVMARADKISNPLWRQSFLENVPSNRAVLARWQGLNATTPGSE